MNCSEIQNHLSAYQDKALPFDLQTEIEAHLQHCQACSRELARLDNLVNLLAELPVESPSPRSLQQLRAKIAAEKNKPRRLTERLAAGWRKVSASRPFQVAIASSMVLLLVVFIENYWDYQKQKMYREAQTRPFVAQKQPEKHADKGFEKYLVPAEELMVSLADSQENRKLNNDEYNLLVEAISFMSATDAHASEKRNVIHTFTLDGEGRQPPKSRISMSFEID